MSNKKKLIIITSMICVLFTWIDMFIFDFGKYSPSRGSIYIGVTLPLLFIIIILVSKKFPNKFKDIDIPNDCKSKYTLIILLMCIVISFYPSVIIFAVRLGYDVYIPKGFRDFNYFLSDFFDLNFY